MKRVRTLVAAVTFVACVSLALVAFAQTSSPLGPSAESSLAEMIGTERAFAARALVVGWKQAFLEYFADSAVGFDGDRTAPAKTLFAEQPDPPREQKLIWEPRFGDIAASGDLGYLTGPVQNINPSRNHGQPRSSTYASVWKRQPDGTFKVVIDAGVAAPGPVVFPPGFTRAPRASVRLSNAQRAAATRSLRDTDAALTNVARTSQADAYRGHLAEGARMHRADLMPLIGQESIVRWLRSQPAYTFGESQFAEAAAAGDLGYTYGRYALAGAMPEHGYYVRVWSRSPDGVWRVALDVTQPQ